MTSFVRMFQDRFAMLVRSRQKRQTIRRTPKRMPRPGDLLRARRWTGKPYRSKQETLIEATITRVEWIEIFRQSARIGQGQTRRQLSIGRDGTEMDAFAQADGFEDWEDLCGWFCDNHHLPFYGIVIYWRTDTEGAEYGQD